MSCTFYAIFMQFGQASYVLEVRAYSYQNPESKHATGECCETFAISNCENQCENRFVFCLRGSSVSNDGNTGNCPLGRYSTGHIGDDSFSFSTPNLASGVPNPMTFTGSVWPVSKQKDFHTWKAIIYIVSLVIQDAILNVIPQMHAVVHVS